MASTGVRSRASTEMPEIGPIDMKPDPERRSYLTYASFSDPDGNGWLLQEVQTRLSGRDWEA